MCDGGGNQSGNNSSGATATAARQRRRRRQFRRRQDEGLLQPDEGRHHVSNNHHNDTAGVAGGGASSLSSSLAAWDRPPPVASPVDSWKPRHLRSRTPQHLVTLSGRRKLDDTTNTTTKTASAAVTPSWSAPPVLCLERYLLAPTTEGHIYVWDLVQIVMEEQSNSNTAGSHAEPEHSGGASVKKESSNTEEPSSSHRETEGESMSRPASTVDTTKNHYEPSVSADGTSPGGLSPFLLNTVSTPHLMIDTTSSSEFIVGESPVPSAGSALVALTVAPPPNSPLLLSSSAALAETRNEAGQVDPTSTTAAASTATTTLVALSVLGIVHVVTLQHHDDENRHRTSGASASTCCSVTVEHSHSWFAGQTGMQCVTVTQRGVIVIGYNTGCIEAWTLEQVAAATGGTKSSTSSPNRSVPGSPTSSGSSSSYKEKLLWRAALDHAPAVRSVKEIRMTPPRQSSPATNQTAVEGEETAAPSDDGGDTIPSNKDQVYQVLVLTLEPDSRTPSASMIEVVNMTTIHRAWDEAVQNNNSGDGTASSTVIPIEDHCILPHPGMEVINCATIPREDSNSSRQDEDLPAGPSWIPSNGTGCLCSIPPPADDDDADAPADHNDDNEAMVESCAAALADGSVLTLSSSSSTRGPPNDITDCWGIQLPTDQLLLSYPAIGMGLVNYPYRGGSRSTTSTTTTKQTFVPHIACCLRGGTTYLIPVLAATTRRRRQQQRHYPLEEEEPVISVVQYPHGVDSDLNFRRVQAFAAGQISSSRPASPSSGSNREVDGRMFGGPSKDKEYEGSRNKRSIPVLIYAWPGGIIDVYAAELQITNASVTASNLLLQNLISNGSAELLRKHLEMDGSEEALSPFSLQQWNSARTEIINWSSSGTHAGGGALSVSDLASPQLQSFRSMLLSLGEESDPCTS